MKHIKLYFACLLMTAFSIGQVWAAVESGTTYSTPSASGVPTGWTSSDGGGTSYVKLTESTHYISTEEFCQNGFTSIKIKARKFGGPSAAQAVISVEWFENGGSSTVLATVSPTTNSLADYPISDLESVTGNKSGYIKISCKEASGGKGCGVSEVTITYAAGTCGGGTPTCALPTFSPEAGSYEGTQNVTITSTEGATIYYTTDGSTPTTSSSVYSSAIPVAADMTIKAFAVKTGSTDSEVATAAYEITEGPDVTLNLIDGNWDFPTSNTTGTETYTNSATGYSVTCYAPTNYKVNGSTYFYLGKSGAYIELPSFSNPIEKIVVTGNSGASTSVIWNIFKGDDAVSTAATGCAEDSYTFNIAEPEANVVYTLKVTSAHNLQIKAIKIFYGAAPAVAKPTISGDENFVGSTSVSISHADADAIYYTTDGSDPKTSGTKLTYSAPFTVNADGTTTVKAYAVKGSDVSAVAEKTFTKVEALESLAALLEATTSSETAFNVVISNWVVTGVNGSRAWIADAANTKGILLYKSGHNFVAGNKLNGVVIGTKSKLYQGYPEMTTLVSTDVTVTTAETVTPRTTTIAALTSGYNAEQGTVVKLEDVTYSSSVLSDGVNSIAADNKLFSSLALIDGTTYDITGVVEYLDESVVKIMPRSIDDVVAKSAVVTPTAANLAALKAAERGTYILTLTNAVVTYVNGNNAFIEDATGGALIYFASHGYSAGDCLNGDYQVTTEDYQGKFEITAMEPQAGAATTTAEIPLTTVTIATLNASFSSYESRRVKIVGANVTDAISGSDRNGAINDGAALAVYAAVASTITLTANDNVDIIGYPGFHNTDQQLTVWAQADITVNEKEDPELAYDPVSETIEQGASWSAPTLTNPHSLTIASYASNNESVATVTGEGVIALAGGLGTAVITAHTDGDATYAAGNATYTITVNEAGTYSMSFDLTRASYDDAADAQVVWNSSVVTMTADKNDGTKVTNYLAGNYSGTTLIAETRLYAKNSISFVPQAGVTITKIEWMSTAKGYATKLAAETFVNATAVVDGTDDKLVIITPSAAGEISVTLTDAARATGVTVYYTAESEKAKLTASISIDDMNMAVGDADILLSAIAATSNPNKKAISYAVTSGTAVTIEGTGAEAALHAAAEGSATITATIPDDLGNYTGATTTFAITVTAGKEDPALAYSPVSETITAGDAWSAPSLVNPHSVTITSYASDNEAVATVTDGGVIALAGGTGTAVITAHFDGDASYLEGDAVYTITVNAVPEPADVCDGSDDFATIDKTVNPTGYATRTTTDGWVGTNVRFQEIDEKMYWKINGKTTAVGTITSPVLSDGIATLKFRYANTDTESNGVSVKIEIKQGEDVVKEYTLTKANSEVTKDEIYTEIIENINVAGDFQIVFTNLSPSNNSSSNKDRVAIGRLCWSSYSAAPEPSYTEVRNGLTEGRHYTVCLEKNVTAVKGATFWSLTYKNAAGTEAYLVQEDAPFAAGTPYIFQATGDNEGKLEVVYGEEVDGSAGTNGALVGTFEDLDADDLNGISGTVYMLFNNELRPIGTSNHLDAHRAYVLYNLLQEVPAAGFAPGKKVKRMPMQGQTTTDCELINAAEAPVKMMINGQLFILRGEKMYDTTGRLVK